MQQLNSPTEEVDYELSSMHDKSDTYFDITQSNQKNIRNTENHTKVIKMPSDDTIRGAISLGTPRASLIEENNNSRSPVKPAQCIRPRCSTYRDIRKSHHQPQPSFRDSTSSSESTLSNLYQKPTLYDSNISSVYVHNKSKVNYVQPIVSQSFHEDASSSSSMSHPSYKEMLSSKTKVKNSVIRSNCGNAAPVKHLNPIITQDQRIKAVTKIQSAYRMWKVVRSYDLYERNRMENRYLLMKQSLGEAETAIENIYESNVGREQLKIAGNVLDNIVKRLSFNNKSIKVFEMNLHKLFSYCDTDKSGYLNRAQVRTLVLVVINFAITNEDFCEEVNELDPKYRNVITFDSFFPWFLHLQKKKKTLRGYIEARRIRKSRNLSLQYTMVRAEYLKTKYYEMYTKIQLDQYDKRNPAPFKCRLCNRSYGNPLRCVHHTLRCIVKNNNLSHF